MSAQHPGFEQLIVTHERAHLVEDIPASHTVRLENNRFPVAVLSNYNGLERARYAQLFAVAPDLLRAARELMGHISDVLGDEAFDLIDTKTWNALGAAIAKATGSQP